MTCFNGDDVAKIKKVCDTSKDERTCMITAVGKSCKGSLLLLTIPEVLIFLSEGGSHYSDCVSGTRKLGCKTGWRNRTSQNGISSVYYGSDCFCRDDFCNAFDPELHPSKFLSKLQKGHKVSSKIKTAMLDCVSHSYCKPLRFTVQLKF